MQNTCFFILSVFFVLNFGSGRCVSADFEQCEAALHDAISHGISASLEMELNGRVSNWDGKQDAVSLDVLAGRNILSKLMGINGGFLNYVPVNIASSPDWIGDRKSRFRALRGDYFKNDFSDAFSQIAGRNVSVVVSMLNVYFRDFNFGEKEISIREAMNMVGNELGCGWCLKKDGGGKVVFCEFYSKGPRARLKNTEDISAIPEMKLEDKIIKLSTSGMDEKIAIFKSLPSRQNLPIQYREIIRKELVESLEKLSGVQRGVLAGELWRFFDYPLSNSRNHSKEIKKRFSERLNEENDLMTKRNITKAIDLIKTGDDFQKIVSIRMIEHAVASTHQFSKGEINYWIGLISNQLMNSKSDPLLIQTACHALSSLCSLEI